MLLPGANLARLAHAVTTGEAIVVYGDYDVDGATSAACVISVIVTARYPFSSKRLNATSWMCSMVDRRLRSLSEAMDTG